MSATLTDLRYRIQHAGELTAHFEQVSPYTTTATSYAIQMPSDDEMRMALAEAKKRCPTCLQQNMKGYIRLPPCSECGDAYLGNSWLVGLVPRFPTLREPCTCISCADVSGVCATCRRLGGHPPGCEACSGRGWVPIQQDVMENVWDEQAKVHGEPGTITLLYRFGQEVISRMMYLHESAQTASLAAAVLMLAEEETP